MESICPEEQIAQKSTSSSPSSFPITKWSTPPCAKNGFRCGGTFIRFGVPEAADLCPADAWLYTLFMRTFSASLLLLLLQFANQLVQDHHHHLRFTRSMHSMPKLKTDLAASQAGRMSLCYSTNFATGQGEWDLKYKAIPWMLWWVTCKKTTVSAT